MAATIVLAPWLSACRVGPFMGDAQLAPFPDAAPDTAPEAPVGPVCDLLAQNCPDKKTCYPVDGQVGQTSCEFTGSAPPSTFCVKSLECDALEACVFDVGVQVTVCATLCDPSAAQTGCLKGSVCNRLPGSRAGTCSI